MLRLICELVIMSISGTIMYALSLPFKGRRYAAARYAMLIAAAAIMLIPVNLAAFTPKLMEVELPREVVTGTGRAAGIGTVAGTTDTAAAAMISVWLLGLLISGIGIIKGYVKTARVIGRVSDRTLDGRIIGIYKSVCGKLSIRRELEIYTSRHLRSPLLFGIIRPRIVLPEREFTDAELELIMAHELTHYKHRDLTLALLAAAVRCVHWFNPCAYLLGAAMEETRELCCDETVLTVMAPNDKKDYGRVIISVIEYGIKGGLAYTTAMAAQKRSIKTRLKKIAHFKRPPRSLKLVCMAAVCACATVSVTAFGFTQAAEAVPTELTHRMADAVRPRPLPKPAPAENTAAPDVIHTPEPSADAVTAVPAETPYAAPTEEAAAEITEQPQIYTFTIDDASDETETPAEPSVFTLPDSAYIFTPDLSSGGTVRSDNFYASEDITLSIQRRNGTIRVYNAADDSLVYDNAPAGRDTFTMPMSAGSTYYVTAGSEEPADVSVYIKAIDR